MTLINSEVHHNVFIQYMATRHLHSSTLKRTDVAVSCLVLSLQHRKGNSTVQANFCLLYFTEVDAWYSSFAHCEVPKIYADHCKQAKIKLTSTAYKVGVCSSIRKQVCHPFVFIVLSAFASNVPENLRAISISSSH